MKSNIHSMESTSLTFINPEDTAGTFTSHTCTFNDGTVSL